MNLRYVVAVLAISTLPVCAGDSWASKDPANWTDKEVRQVLNKSPWAKEASTAFNPERMGRMGGPEGGGPGMGGPGMGGPGGGPGRSEGDQEMSPPKATIRWVSATPLQEAIAKGGSGFDPKAVADWSKEYYVIAVSGLGMGPRGGRRRGVENFGDRPPRDPERMKQMRERMQERMKQATALHLTGQDAIAPARIEMVEGDQGRITVFLFPRTRAISADDKEVSFETAMGPLEVKTKFVLKDMQYHGKLAL
jgi:hypothetical protein